MAANATLYADEHDEALITDINVTPLVDIVLVLLIVFMITMPMIVTLDKLKERELKVDLAEAGQAVPLIAKPKELIVSIDAGGAFSVKDQRQSREDLLKVLRAVNAANPGRATVLIRADKQCPWQYVAQVMALCTEAEIRDYRMSTE